MGSELCYERDLCWTVEPGDTAACVSVRRYVYGDIGSGMKERQYSKNKIIFSEVKACGWYILVRAHI